MKTILIATDYSKAATNALAYAANLTKQLQARLILCHAYYMLITHMNVPKELPGERELIEEHMGKLNKLADEVTKNYGIAVECMTGPMPAVDYLKKTVHQTKADLVVMGRKELSKLDQRLFGSTAISVINESAFPVLVVPNNRPYSPLSRIMLATDFHPATPKNLFLLKGLALTYQAQLQVLYIAKNLEETSVKATLEQSSLEPLLQGLQHEYLISQHNDVDKGIIEGIAQFQPDLLVMLPQKHDFWDVAFNLSHTRKLAFETDIPLLALPASSSIEREYKVD